MKFCNKHCEKEAHTKEKSTKKEPENLSGTEDLLKKVMEAEMKRQDKKDRISNRFFKMLATSCMSTYHKDTWKAFKEGTLSRSN